jgi:hypothetical protein
MYGLFVVKSCLVIALELLVVVVVVLTLVFTRLVIKYGLFVVKSVVVIYFLPEDYTFFAY